MSGMAGGTITSLGEHAVPLWMDKKLVPKAQSLTVKVVQKR